MEPVGAPICWGKQFGDEDDECKNCRYNMSCRPATINYYAMKRPNTSLPQPSYSLPVINHQPGYPQFGSPPSLPPTTLPQPSSYPRSVLPHPSAPPAHPSQHMSVGFQPHAPAGWNTPIAYLPRPNPGNPAWWQYQSETTKSRLGKNLILSALQAIFAELLRFFANWTWPQKLATT